MLHLPAVEPQLARHRTVAHAGPTQRAHATMDEPLPGYLGLTTLSPGRSPKN